MVKDIFFFDKMLTPKIIIFVYWLLLLSAAGSGIGIMFAGDSFFGGLAAAIGGAIGARILCELLIVMFKMNEALQELRTK
jgi:hypothetical protein